MLSTNPFDWSRRYICAACGFKGRVAPARRGPAVRCAGCATWTPARPIAETLAIAAEAHGKKLKP